MYVIPFFTNLDITGACVIHSPCSPHPLHFLSLLAVIRKETFLFVFRLSGMEQQIPEKEVRNGKRGIIILSFLPFMPNQSWGIFRAELCCFRGTSSIQLKLLTNLYLHKQTLTRLERYMEKSCLALTLSKSPNASHKWAERLRSSQMWRQKQFAPFCCGIFEVVLQMTTSHNADFSMYIQACSSPELAASLRSLQPLRTPAACMAP